MTRRHQVSGAELLRHALGVHCYGRTRRGRRWSRPYRSWFCAGLDDQPAWRSLAEKGPLDDVKDEAYRVTASGREYALAGIAYSAHHAARWGYGDPAHP